MMTSLGKHWKLSEESKKNCSIAAKKKYQKLEFGLKKNE